MDLTDDERHVLRAVQTGQSTHEIATMLGLTSERVRVLTGSCMTKLGARSKLEMLIMAIRQGLV